MSKPKVLTADHWRNTTIKEELDKIADIYRLDLSKPVDRDKAAEILLEHFPDVLNDTPELAWQQRRKNLVQAAMKKVDAQIAQEEAEAALREAERAKEAELKASAVVGAWSETFQMHLSEAGYPEGIDINEHNPHVLNRYREAFNKTVRQFIPRKLES